MEIIGNLAAAAYTIALIYGIYSALMRRRFLWALGMLVPLFSIAVLFVWFRYGKDLADEQDVERSRAGQPVGR